MKPEDIAKSSETKVSDPHWNQDRTISDPGAALEVKVVHMPESIRVAIGNAFNAGNAQRAIKKKLFSFLF